MDEEKSAFSMMVNEEIGLGMQAEWADRIDWFQGSVYGKQCPLDVKEI